jgi:hypothetical protein
LDRNLLKAPELFAACAKKPTRALFPFTVKQGSDSLSFSQVKPSEKLPPLGGLDTLVGNAGIIKEVGINNPSK